MTVVSDKQQGARSAIGAVSRPPAILLRIKIMLLAAGVLFAVGATAFLCLDHLKDQAWWIVNDTLPGLSYAGEANAYLAENTRTLIFVLSNDAGQREEIRKEIKSLSARTTAYLKMYNASVYDQQDRANYQNLIQARTEYIQIRDHVLQLAADGNRDEALALYKQSLVPKHEQVKSAGDTLFRYNMDQAQSRGKRMMAFCSALQVAIGVFCVVVFVVGFILGLFK